MTTVVIVGAQWGDEGKGKLIDFLASEAEMVIRSQGGSNAGHTVVAGEDVYKLHLIPSGILYPEVTCIVGNGVVVDLEVIIKELDDLGKRGIKDDNLYISDRAQMIMPYHYLIDELQEDLKGDSKIGTTKRGIGPAYTDKYARSGLRIADLFHWDAFCAKVQANVEEKNRYLASYGRDGVDAGQIIAQFALHKERIQKYVADTAVMANEAIDAKRRVLFEGAQGTLLDIDQGTYPFVTSSYPTAGGACTGSGVGPTKIDRVLGIVKAYTSRVGDGPFPTELNDATGEHIRDKGFEYGTTTGRPRRCGWLDGVVLKYSSLVNGLTDLAITKLDVLSGMEELKLCIGYEIDGKLLTSIPADLETLSQCVPVYESMPGWNEDISNCLSMTQLPENALKYLKRVEDFCGVPISIVSVGPERSQTIVINQLFEYID